MVDAFVEGLHWVLEYYYRCALMYIHLNEQGLSNLDYVAGTVFPDGLHWVLKCYFWTDHAFQALCCSHCKLACSCHMHLQALQAVLMQKYDSICLPRLFLQIIHLLYLWPAGAWHHGHGTIPSTMHP